MKFPIIPAVISVSFLLSACSDSRFEEEAKRVEQVKAEKEKAEAASQLSDKEKYEVYKKMEKPLDEVILENDLDVLEEVSNIEVETKDQYEDATEFSKYASQVLYNFYLSQIDAKKYYDFLLQHGSERVKSELPSEKDTIAIFTSIQESFKKQNITGDSYTLTNLSFDRMKREGNFYRKVVTTNGEEYFITTIKKENGVWKYEDDSPAPPYLLGTDLNQIKEETTTE
ncbi:hypothetical protein ACVBAX_21330 [Robertmurraya sp. GLU-23]